MNKLVCFAALAVFPLIGCSTAPANNVTAASPASGEMYCWRDRLAGTTGTLDCNWASSRKEACDSDNFAKLEAARYTEPRKAGMCANGQWLVVVQSR